MNYLSMIELRARGWNDRLVRKFLGDPDQFRLSMQGGRPQRLYRLDRVEAIERFQPAFAVAQERKDFLSRRARKSIESKSLHLNEIVDSIPLVPLIQPFEQLLAEARLQSTVMVEKKAGNRVALEILLDRLKPLYDALSLYMWHSGVREARMQLRTRILAHIVKHYPALQEATEEHVELHKGG